MYMLNEILKEVVGLIAGERSKTIIDLLEGKKNVNEFLIAKKLKITINQTRNILYKLGDEGLVSFVRKKDAKKGGWYTYFWTLNPEKGIMKFKDELLSKIDSLKLQMETKKKERFYHSPNCNLEFNESEALNHDYSCPECGEILQLKDNEKVVIAVEKELRKNEQLMEKVMEEIKILLEKSEKIKQKKLKVEEKKKKEERELKKIKRAKEKKLLEKNSGKSAKKK